MANNSVKKDNTTINQLRHSYARSDFEKLVCSTLPASDIAVTTIKHYTVDQQAMVTALNNLRTDVESKLGKLNGAEWGDSKKLGKQIQVQSLCECDLYLEFDRNNNTSIPFTLDDLLGNATDRFVVAFGNGGKATDLIGKNVWIEVSADPFHSRYKLFQLLRSVMVLKPTGPVIGVICLNQKVDDYEKVVNRFSAFATEKFLSEFCKSNRNSAGEPFDFQLILVWTQNRNIVTWLQNVERKLQSLQETVERKLRNLTIGMVILTIGMVVLARRLNGLDQRLDHVEQVLQLIMDRMDRMDRPWWRHIFS